MVDWSGVAGSVMVAGDFGKIKPNKKLDWAKLWEKLAE